MKCLVKFAPSLWKLNKVLYLTRLMSTKGMLATFTDPEVSRMFSAFIKISLYKHEPTVG